MEVGGGGGGGGANQGEVPKNHAREKNAKKIVHSKQPGKILASDLSKYFTEILARCTRRADWSKKLL